MIDPLNIERINYLLIMVSVIAGAVVLEQINAWVLLLKSLLAGKARWSWRHAAWNFIILYTFLFYWWAFWEHIENIGSNFFNFFIVLMNPTIYYVLIKTLNPSQKEIELLDGPNQTKRLDLGDFFEKVQIQFYLFSALLSFFSYLTITQVYDPDFATTEEQAVRFISLGSFLLASFVIWLCKQSEQRHLVKYTDLALLFILLSLSNRALFLRGSI